MKQVALKLMRVAGSDMSVPLPAYETSGAAGADLRANFRGGAAISIKPGARALIPTGLAMAVPAGYEVQVRPRSGLALRHGIALVNSPGTIDSDYRGEVGVIILNTSDEAFEVTQGMRVAQMVVAPVVQAEFRQVEALDATERGAGGFGSTGRD